MKIMNIFLMMNINSRTNIFGTPTIAMFNKYPYTNIVMFNRYHYTNVLFCSSNLCIDFIDGDYGIYIFFLNKTFKAMV